jgi:UTP--glucose-1-phosphate uridylyltransferase
LVILPIFIAFKQARLTMKIKKAVITAAARGERLYPVSDTIQKAMLPVVDTDGLHKPVLQIICEEAFSSGVEEICVVCAPGDDERYRNAFALLRENLLKSFKGIDWAKAEAEKLDHLIAHLQFVEQKEPKGYGHAVHCAKGFVGNESFLLLLGDYLYVSYLKNKRCAAQLIELAEAENCAVSAVNPTIEHQISRYGTLTGKHVANQDGVYQIEKIIEKPSLSTAELELQTPGLRAGYYLCFFGMHVLTPTVFSLLEKQLDSNTANVLLTPSLQDLASTEKYLALEVKGRRYDLSRKHGLLRAQIALGLAGEAHDETLTTMVELLAEANAVTR